MDSVVIGFGDFKITAGGHYWYFVNILSAEARKCETPVTSLSSIFPFQSLLCISKIIEIHLYFKISFD